MKKYTALHLRHKRNSKEAKPIGLKSDYEGSKLKNVEEYATSDQTGEEIKALYEAEDDTNAYTDAEKTKLSGVETGANVTDAENVASSIHGASAKTTPVDDDELPLIDSEASNALKSLLFSDLKAALKTYFDPLYQSIPTTTTTPAPTTTTTPAP